MIESKTVRLTETVKSRALSFQALPSACTLGPKIDEFCAEVVAASRAIPAAALPMNRDNFLDAIPFTR
jgi:hypothetical protein